jgi:pseudouridine synthase
MERLQKFLARAGVASRREAEKYILAGRVAVNGEIVSELGTKIEPESDLIAVDGQVVSLAEKKYYVLLNKPGGYITTASDERGRKTVMDLVSDIPARLYPVGRLDAQTEGLLLLTNDGDLAYRLTHPRFSIPKKYRVIVHGQINDDTVRKWQEGIMLEDGMTAPAEVSIGYARPDLSEIIVTIHEGKNRQIRRMARTTGYHVYFLERIGYASLTLENVRRGEYRHLTHSEVSELFTAAGNA